MRRDVLPGQTRTLRCCCPDVLLQSVAQPRRGERLAASVQEDLGGRNRTAYGQPGSQGPRRFLPQREAALPPSLSMHEDAGIRTVEFNVVETETHQFRGTQAGGEAKIEHRLVTDSVARTGIRGIEDRLHFLPGQMVDQSFLVPFVRQRPDLTELIQRRGRLVLDVLHERADGGQPYVPRPRCVAGLS